MVAPPEDQIGHGAASYVPEPFEGLPEVFAPDEHAARTWRKLRPHKSSRAESGEGVEASLAAQSPPAVHARRGRQPTLDQPPEPSEQHQPPHVLVSPVARREQDEPPSVPASPQSAPPPQVDVPPQAQVDVPRQADVPPKIVASQQATVPPHVPVPPTPSQPSPDPQPVRTTPTLASLVPAPVDPPAGPPLAPPAGPALASPAGPPLAAPLAPPAGPPLAPPSGPRPQPRHAALLSTGGPSGPVSARSDALPPIIPAPPHAVFERQVPLPAEAAPMLSEPPAIAPPSETAPAATAAPPAHRDGLPGYQPLPYEPSAGNGFGPLNLAFPGGQLGTVYPTRRTGRGVWITLLLIVALAAGFVVWRVRDHGSTTPAATGVDYRSPAGHFSAHFPAEPVELSSTRRSGRVRATYRGASVPDEATTVIETDIAGPLPRDQRGELAQFIAGFQSGGDVTVTRLHTVSFRGHPAREGSYLTPAGQLDTVLFVAYSERQLFVLMAPTGAPFDTLRDSFAVFR